MRWFVIRSSESPPDYPSCLNKISIQGLIWIKFFVIQIKREEARLFALFYFWTFVASLQYSIFWQYSEKSFRRRILQKHITYLAWLKTAVDKEHQKICHCHGVALDSLTYFSYDTPTINYWPWPIFVQGTWIHIRLIPINYSITYLYACSDSLYWSWYCICWGVPLS